MLARRRAAFARVYGAGRVGACVATFLASSGVAWVSCVDPATADAADIAPAGLGTADVGAGRAAGMARAVQRVAPETRTADDARRRPDLAVITGRPDPVLLATLTRERVPHLAGGGGGGDRDGGAAGAARPVGLRSLRRPEQGGP